MKPTRLYLVAVQTRFFWNCWKCGVMNSITVDGEDPVYPTRVQCEQCNSVRKVIIRSAKEYKGKERLHKKLLQNRINYLNRKRKQFLKSQWWEDERKKIANQVKRDLQAKEKVKSNAKSKNN